MSPQKENGLRVVNALRSLQLDVPEFSPEEFERYLELAFGFPPDAVDLLNNTPGIDFHEAYINSLPVKMDDLTVRLIDILDLIRNKESLRRTGEKAHLDKYDLEVLKKIVRNQR